jgi:hypothetical protein
MMHGIFVLGVIILVGVSRRHRIYRDDGPVGGNVLRDACGHVGSFSSIEHSTGHGTQLTRTPTQLRPLWLFRGIVPTPRADGEVTR